MSLEEHYDFAIIGAGISGATAFYYLSKLGKCILIEKKSEPEKYSAAKLLPVHTFPLIPKEMLDDDMVFTKDHITTFYASKTIESKIDGKEFGGILGKVMDEYGYLCWNYNKGKENGGKILWNSHVSHIEINSDDVILSTNKNVKEISQPLDIVKASLLVIATGAHSFNLQKSLGFETPQSFNIIMSTFYGKPEDLERNIPVDYTYRIHHQISLEGPLAMTRSKDYFNLGYLSSESYDEMSDKLLRILKNYQPIQGFFKNLKPSPNELKSEDLVRWKCTKYPIKSVAKDRVVVIGEAAGWVTSCYFEGLIGCIASAKFLWEILSKTPDKKFNYKFSDLALYEKRLRKFLHKYFASQDASESLFLKSGKENQIELWNAYLKTIEKSKQVRKNIYDAYVNPNIENYPLENDQWVGEQIFKNLPFGRKIALTPLFLKLKFS